MNAKQEQAARNADSMIDWLANEVESAKAEAKRPVEAYGVKGLKSTAWRKTFKNADALNKWAEKNSADVHGVRFPE